MVSLVLYHSLLDDKMKTLLSGDHVNRGLSHIGFTSSTVLKKIYAKEDLYNHVDPGPGLGAGRDIMPTEWQGGCCGYSKDGSLACTFKTKMDQYFQGTAGDRSCNIDGHAYVTTMCTGDKQYFEVARWLQLDHPEGDLGGDANPSELTLDKYIEGLPLWMQRCIVDHQIKGWACDDFTTFRLDFDNWSGGPVYVQELFAKRQK